MARWRPSYDEEYRETLQEFLDDHPELPFDTPRDMMKYCTDNFVADTVRISRTDDKIKDMIDQQD